MPGPVCYNRQGVEETRRGAAKELERREAEAEGVGGRVGTYAEGG